MHKTKAIFHGSTAVALALTSTLGVMGLTAPVALASTTVDTLANQIVTLGTQARSGGTLSTLATPLLNTMSQSNFDWNEVLFGTDSLSSTQQKTATALTPDIRQIATFSVTTQSAATSLINDVVQKMQNLNPAIQTSDVLTFLEAIEQQSPNEVVNLLSLSATPTAAQIATSMHSFFNSNLNAASAAIQSIFSTTGPSTSTSSGVGPVGTGSAGGSGAGAPSGSSGAGTSSTAGNGNGNSILGTLLKQIVVNSSGMTMNSTVGSTAVSLVVPKDAFSQEQQISLTTGDTKNLPAGIPQGYQPQLAFGISFNGGAPKQALTLTIQNSAITANDKVYKISGDKWIPVSATVTQGKVEITFSSDPDFVIAEANASKQGQGSGSASGSVGQKAHLLPYQRVITLPGINPMVVPGQVRNNTTYMPIWYVMRMLQSLHIDSKWDGGNWRLTTQAGSAVDYSNINLGRGPMKIYLNSKAVINITGFAAVDPTSSKLTTYMPIYDVMLVLRRLHIQSSWDGTTWGLTQK